jgi:hypothetical protein
MNVSKQKAMSTNTSTNKEAEQMNVSEQKVEITTTTASKEAKYKTVSGQEAEITTNTPATNEAMSNTKKGPTTIFPKRKVLQRKKREAGKKAEDEKPAEETLNSSDDDELLRAAEALEKVVTVSDEEWMEAAMVLEQMELGVEEEVHEHQANHNQEGDKEVDGNQGCQMKGIRQVEANLSKQEACHIPDQKLSFRMVKNHPERNQEWKERHDGQAGRVRGQGRLQVQGVHHHVQEGEQAIEETGAWGPPGSLPPLPSSPSTSGGSSTSSPPTPRKQQKTPGSRPPRVVVTPLWKRKSMYRKSSSYKSPRAAILRMSQMTSQEDNNTSQAVTKASRNHLQQANRVPHSCGGPPGITISQ